MISNNVQIIATLGQDPEIKNFESGKQLLQFSAAHNSYYTNEGEKVETTDWFNFKTWNIKLAEIMISKLSKGSRALFSGKLTVNNYTNGDGVKISRVEIDIQEFQVLHTQNSQSAE